MHKVTILCAFSSNYKEMSIVDTVSQTGQINSTMCFRKHSRLQIRFDRTSHRINHIRGSLTLGFRWEVQCPFNIRQYALKLKDLLYLSLAFCNTFGKKMIAAGFFMKNFARGFHFSEKDGLCKSA